MADFTYYNINPRHYEEEDCVCRAISAGTGIDYYVVENLLELVADFNDCNKLCVCCYHILLEDVFMLPVRFCYNGETVGEIANMYKNNTVIIRIEGHLTYAVCGELKDLWDCRDKEVDCYWIAPIDKLTK